MEIGSRRWCRLIMDGAKHLNVVLDQTETEKFAVHAQELTKWNQKINLTAVTDPASMAVKHFLDSIAPARFIPHGARLLDIGSGGGFPGIPLKILLPRLRILLIDASRKKVNFQKHLIRTLNLDDIQAEHERAEGLAKDPSYCNAFDVVISRALTSLPEFVNVAEPLVNRGGMIIAMRGKLNHEQSDTDSLDGLECKDGFELEVMSYRLPVEMAERSLMVFRRVLDAP